MPNLKDASSPALPEIKLSNQQVPNFDDLHYIGVQMPTVLEKTEKVLRYSFHFLFPYKATSFNHITRRFGTAFQNHLLISLIFRDWRELIKPSEKGLYRCFIPSNHFQKKTSCHRKAPKPITFPVVCHNQIKMSCSHSQKLLANQSKKNKSKIICHLFFVQQNQK